MTGFRPTLFAAVLVLTLPAVTPAQEIPEADAYCLECHEDDSLVLELDDGTEMLLYVDYESYSDSRHGDQLLCTDCHELYEEEHPTGATFPSLRSYTLGSYDLCKKCHFDTYTRTLDSVHQAPLEAENPRAPVCTSCHGAHDIADPHDRQAMVSRTCAGCHEAIYATYSRSVHGRALVDDDNHDVPTCSDCHTAHSMTPPGTPRFRMDSPTTCIGCHSNQEMMDRYDIPTDVATSYLADFHGVTASLSGNTTIDERQLVVTCVDCHGVHDIESPALVGAVGMKERVEASCASCHEGAAEDFPAAWLSHFRPGLQHAPLVWLVELFYKLFIPFMVLGLSAHILLHLYRVARIR